MLNLNSLLPLFVHYKYLIIFPIAAIEGPIITVICGFLVSLGFLSLLIVYFVIVGGDLAGDSMYYVLGRYGGRRLVDKYGHYIGITLERVVQMEKSFEQHPKKIFSIGKVAHGVGTVVLVAAGMAKFPFWQFIGFNVLPTAVKSLLLLLAGFYFGQAFARINSYLDFGAIILAIVFVTLYFVAIKTKIVSKIIKTKP